MKRAALIAGLSIVAFSAAPTGVRAWPGDFDSLSRGDQPASPHIPPAQQTTRPRPRKPERHESKTDKTPPIPSGLQQIIVSIDKQRATLFADGVSVASTAVSTGTADHPTPMGVFTVIQKDRHHVSNLYNAPMPYMQRFTWSGSALHEGPLPGYPASHGCVRLTSSFAQLLWKATKMGVRIVVTRPEVSPLAFEHPRLFVPRPKMVEMPGIPLPAPKPVTALPEPAAEPTAGLAGKPAFTSSVTKIRTADAGNTIGVAIASLVGNEPKTVGTSVAERTAEVPAAEQPANPPLTDGAGGAPKHAMPAAVAAPPAEGNGAAAKLVETTPSKAQAAEAKPAEAAPVEIQGFEMWPAAPVETQAVQAKPAELAPTEAQAVEAKPVQIAPVETQAVETKPSETAPNESQATAAKPVTAPPEAQAAETKPAESVVEAKPVPAIAALVPTITSPASIIVDERPKAMPATVVREANGRPVSVFVSLKESKLYVRQGWKPLFDAPVSFEHPEQPIGTHVYTAMGHKVTGDGLRWTVISIPSSTRRAAEAKSSRKGAKGQPPHVKPIAVAGPLPSPATALDRIVIAPELVERISELITPGSSLIVSDNRLSDETGEYTDFIVLTR